ncbi:ATP-dependent DNA ligase [Streptomyces millisiae]|uniref:DNA ligase n=1 Tax=Streptomyces millisiae TaxID=3075542 RepID=A0ABU2LS23_9ACTN|nr:ATP-dependent DNA ligase [Streptomyces sp. DSM 44918]MDT0320389.1 ATP-dependent DNA ligase [Streptomyces sp. DSM 44918]
MLLADVARTSREVAATRSRSAKVAALAGLLAGTEPAQAPVVVTYLAGRLPQRRLGVGWRALSGQRPPPAPEPRLTVAATDAALADIAAASGAGATGRRRELLGALFAEATEEEQDFLIRLISGELRQGALDALAAEGLAAAVGAAPDEVRRAVMLGGSLGAVAEALLARGRDALAEFRLTVGRPVLPMLAQSAEDLDEALDRLGPCVVEEKLDGIRVQVHRDGDAVRIFTRTLDEITDRLPEVRAAALELDVASAVLDGEVIAFDEAGRPHPFQDVSLGAPPGVSRGRVGSLSGALPLSPVFFDLLTVDGRDLLGLPTERRHAELARVAPEPRRVRRLPVPEPASGESRRAAREFAEAVLARGHEGVLVKALDAPYNAGRRGAAWLKVKPVHTLDLVVLAAEWGHGRRRGRLSNLHLGARSADGTSFVMLGKTFKGMTDAMLAWQTERLLELAEDDGGRDRRDGGVVRVRPELVVEVAFDGVQRSTLPQTPSGRGPQPAGVTLRFARVLRYREDKRAADPEAVASVDSVLALLPGRATG